MREEPESGPCDRRLARQRDWSPAPGEAVDTRAFSEGDEGSARSKKFVLAPRLDVFAVDVEWTCRGCYESVAGSCPAFRSSSAAVAMLHLGRTPRAPHTRTTLAAVRVWLCIAATLLLAAGCTIDQGGTDAFAADDTGTSGTSTSATATATATGTGSSSGVSTSSTSSVADEGSGGSSSEGTGSGTSTGSSTSSGEEGCGNRIQEGDEECDDGNDDDFDECTSQCTIPVCDDGEHNGDETDIDCGGPCQGCALCFACEEAADCGGDDMICNADGQCVTHYEISVDWENNCPSSAQGVTVEAMEAGTYVATASQSAGTIWLPPHSPPTTGYFYEAVCTGVTFDEMRTPAGIRYINPNTAFSMMVSETEVIEHAGGDFTCWRDDDGCDDNAGGVDFSLEYVCE